MTVPKASRTDPFVLCHMSAHQGTVFLNQVVAHPGRVLWANADASNFEPMAERAWHRALNLCAVSPENLRAGRCWQIAHGQRFLTSGVDHALSGLKSCSFPGVGPVQISNDLPDTSQTITGHDISTGCGAIVCRDAQNGSGVRVATVRGRMPDDAIVEKDTSRVVQRRFSRLEIRILNARAWLDWGIERMAAALSAWPASDTKGFC